MRRLFLCLFLMLIIAGYPCEGYSWTLPENISNNIGRSVRPDIVIDSKGFIHVFWNDNTTGNHEILYSFNNGQGFSEALQLSSNSGPSTRPQAVIDSSDNIHVIWYDYSSGNAEILYVKGREYSWSQPINISQTPKGSLWPDIAIDSNDKLFVVWSDNSSGNYDILLKTSINELRKSNRKPIKNVV